MYHKDSIHGVHSLEESHSNHSVDSIISLITSNDSVDTSGSKKSFHEEIRYISDSDESLPEKENHSSDSLHTSVSCDSIASPISSHRSLSNANDSFDKQCMNDHSSQEGIQSSQSSYHDRIQSDCYEDSMHDLLYSKESKQLSSDSSSLSDSLSIDELGTIIRESLYSNPSRRCSDGAPQNAVNVQSIQDSDIDSIESSIDSIKQAVNQTVDDSSKSLTMLDDREYLEFAHQKLPYFQSIRELEAVGCPFRILCISYIPLAFKKMFTTTKRTKTVEELKVHPPKYE